METLKKVYVSPDGMVLSKNEIKPHFSNGIRRYPLEKGRWYKISKKEEIPTGPYGESFIWVVQYEDDELFKNIPHNPEYFITVEEWRDIQLKKLI